MACGLPVLCGEADGSEEDLIIDGVTGCWLDGRGPESVVRGLGRIAGLDSTEIQETGRRTSEHVARVAGLDVAAATIVHAIAQCAELR